ncbi:putative Non-specific protein-tyrosine kinase [Rhodospirillaceae bacterium LM-1]|nr:putative Non-specific protein-tyrosine kinase [Rhodospirillaceae bacterium LM-1]
MPPPTLTIDQIQNAFPEIEFIAPPIPGGQKLVFICRKDGEEFVLKVLKSHHDVDDSTIDTLNDFFDEVFERAKREVDILSRSRSQFLPSLGPIPLQKLSINGCNLVVFSEEFIDGTDVDRLIQDCFQFNLGELIKIGIAVASAIGELWSYNRTHRDIKPQNIMRRANGEYVLLDPGIAFDLDDISLTSDGFIPHTPGFIAPECLNLAAKRDTDFRSDFFLLGIVLYICANNGLHPFKDKAGISRQEVNYNILHNDPPRINLSTANITDRMEGIILRLLSKNRHSRYRSVEKLIQDFDDASEV